MMANKENPAYSPALENGEETDTKQPFSNDNLILPNALKGKDLHPKSPITLGTGAVEQGEEIYQVWALRYV